MERWEGEEDDGSGSLDWSFDVLYTIPILIPLIHDRFAK
jgi:hypothetical protein